jgi:hypothetical protein
MTAMKKLTSLILVFTSFAIDAQACVATPNKEDAPHLQKPFVNPTDNPDLPNVLIIGDSISIGYTIAVRKLLNGKADVFRPAGNCMYSGHGAKTMKAWVANRKWDVIHFNFGIWDTHYLHNGKLIMPNNLGNYKIADLKRRYTHQQYIKNLKSVLKEVKRTKAKLIWASTTPFVSYGKDTKKFLAENNKLAAKLMQDNRIVINDLYALARPKLKQWQQKDGCHFNPEGYTGLATQVAAKIAAEIKPKARKR